MACESIVRVADGRDYQECWRLMLQSHKENGLFPLSPQKVDWYLRRFLFSEEIPPDDTGFRGVLGVIGSSESLEGLCGVCISDIWYTETKHLADFVLFVDPEHRHQITPAK